MVKYGGARSIPLDQALALSGWPAAEAARALELALIDRRFRDGTWRVSERDAALLLLARQTAELVGVHPALRTLSLWRSTFTGPLREDVLVVGGALEARYGRAALEPALASGRPLLAVSLEGLLRTLRERLAGLQRSR